MQTRETASLNKTLSRPLKLTQIAIKGVQSAERATLKVIDASGAKILDWINKLPHKEIDAHVDDYRRVIRENHWLNEPRPKNTDQFLSEYLKAAGLYISVGAEAFAFLSASGSRRLSSVFDRVEASEALRGQFGKRAPDGIDARIEHISDEINERLCDFFSAEQAEEYLILIGSPDSSLQTAEAEWLSSAVKVLERNMLGNSREDSNSVDVEWWDLLGHYQWSLTAATRHMATLDLDALQEQRKEIAENNAIRDAKVANAMAAIRAAVSSQDAARILEASDALMALNFLNLRLEPIFSFKGPFGLAHLQILKAGARSGLAVGSNPSRVSRNKWALFNEV